MSTGSVAFSIEQTPEGDVEDAIIPSATGMLPPSKAGTILFEAPAVTIPSKRLMTTETLPAHSWSCTIVDDLRKDRSVLRDLQLWVKECNVGSIDTNAHEEYMQRCPRGVGFSYSQEWEIHSQTCACQHYPGDFAVWGKSLMVLINRTSAAFKRELDDLLAVRQSMYAASTSRSTANETDISDDMFSVDCLGDL